MLQEKPSKSGYYSRYASEAVKSREIGSGPYSHWSRISEILVRLCPSDVLGLKNELVEQVIRDGWPPVQQALWPLHVLTHLA